MTIVRLRNEYNAISDHPADTSVSPENGYTACEPLTETPSSVVGVFFLLGVGVLLPWNALLSAIDFYSVLFPNISVAQYITNGYTFPFMVSGTLLAVSSKLSRHRQRIILLGFIVLTVLPILFPLLTGRDQPFGTSAQSLASTELWFTVLTSAVIGAVSAVLQSTLFGMVSLFPGGRCTTAFTAGGGVASIFIAGLRIFFRLVMDGDSQGSLEGLRPGFRAFFITCSVLCGFCVAVFLWLDQYSMHYAYYVPSSYDTEQDQDGQTYPELWERAKVTLRDISKPAVCALLSFTVTLSLFPGILVQVPTALRESVSPAMRSWYPLIVVALFAVGDTVGRGFPTEAMATLYSNALPLLILGRIVLIPFYLLQWTGFLPVNWPIVVSMVTALGIANGLVVTWAFLSVPSLTPTDRREVAGRLMFVMLISGMSIGNVLGWIVESILRCSTDF